MNVSCPDLPLTLAIICPLGEIKHETAAGGKVADPIKDFWDTRFGRGLKELGSAFGIGGGGGGH